MRVSILLRITDDDGHDTGATEEIAAFEKATARLEDPRAVDPRGKAMMLAVQRRGRSDAGR